MRQALNLEDSSMPGGLGKGGFHVCYEGLKHEGEIKMKANFRFQSVVTGLLILVFLAGCSGAATSPAATGNTAAPTNILDKIVAAGTIKIAVPEDTPLFGTLAGNGSYEGYDVDIANMLAKDLGVKVELVPVSSQNRIPYLTTGKVDLVISSMGIKPERALVINFSNAYAPFFWAVYGPADKKVTNVEEAKTYKVGATLGTLEEVAFSDAAGAGANISRFDDQATTVQAFLTGQVDLIVTGNAIAAQIMKDHPEMKLESKFVLQQSPCHIGVRRGDEALLTWVNAFIYSHTLNHDLDKLSMKWFGEPLPQFPNF